MSAWDVAALEQFIKELPARARKLRNLPKADAKKLAVEYSISLKRLLDRIIDE